MSEKAYIEFRTHAVTITRTDDQIRCFKFAGPIERPRCEYQIFTNENDATEFIVEPFPIDWWELSFHD